MFNKISSREKIISNKENFYKDLFKLKSKLKIESFDKFINNSNEVFVSEGGLKVGPVFGYFNQKDNYLKSYKEIVADLMYSFNPFKINISKSNRLKENIQEMAMSIKPISLDIETKTKPNFLFNTEKDKTINPIGFKAKLTNISLNSNPKIPSKVDSVLNDNLKTIDMLEELDNYKFDNYYITKLFSASLLGKEKRFVSTRQSITAVDDLLGKKLISEIKHFEENVEIVLYKNEFLHNIFYIVFLPGSWEYEQFELWFKGSDWYNFGYNQEYEGYNGRKKYAKLQAGGYYAARLGVVEFLKNIKKQSKIIVIRLIKEDYNIPVGVWQVRENIRNAFKNKKKIFADKEELKNYLKKEIKEISFIRNSNILFQHKLIFK